MTCAGWSHRICPQRVYVAGLFRGVSNPARLGLDLTVNPGLVEILSFPSFVTFTAERGLADRTTLADLIAGARAWGDDPHALWASVKFGATGWAE